MLHQSLNLERVKQDRLRRLLDSDGFDVLVEVLESKAFAHEVDTANYALEGTSGYDNKAKDSARLATSAHDAIKLLKSMRDSDKIFTVSTAKPSSPKPPTK